MERMAKKLNGRHLSLITSRIKNELIGEVKVATSGVISIEG